jgi:hypothetical protein
MKKLTTLTILFCTLQAVFGQQIILKPKWKLGDSKILELKSISPVEDENVDKKDVPRILGYDTSITKVKWSVLEVKDDIAKLQWEVLDFKLDTTLLEDERLETARKIIAVNKGAKYIYYTKENGLFDDENLEITSEENIIKNACATIGVPYIEPDAEEVAASIEETEENGYITDFTCDEIRNLVHKNFQEQITLWHSYFGDTLIVGEKRSLDELHLEEELKDLGEMIEIKGSYVVNSNSNFIKVTYDAQVDMMGMIKMMMGAFQEAFEGEIKDKSKKKNKKKNIESESSNSFDEKLKELENLSMIMNFNGYGIFDPITHIPNEMQHIISIDVKANGKESIVDTTSIIREIN